MAGFRNGRYYDPTNGAPERSTAIAPNTSGRTRAAGFGGLETDPTTRNLRPASFESVYGRAAPQTAKNPIRDVFADAPRPQMQNTSGSSMGGALAAKVGEKAFDKFLGKQISNPFASAQFEPIGPATGSVLDPGVQSSGAVTYPVYDSGAGITTTDIPSDVSVNPVSDSGDGLRSFDIPMDGLGVSSTSSWAGDGLGFDAWGGGADLAGEAAGEAAGAFGGFDGFGGYVGPAIKLFSGDVEGAAKQAAGVAIGTAIGGPIGGAIGGFIGGACFITEATMSGIGLQGEQLERSEPLQVLRWFRDNVMMRTPDGQRMVQQYYLMAPDVVAAINSRPDSEQLYRQMFGQFIRPAVEAIKANDFQKALQLYAEMIQFAAPFGAEMEGEFGEESDFNELASDAATVNADPDLQQAAIGSGVLGRVMAR